MKKALTWILVRHGDTEWTEQNKLHGGRLDSPLSAKGRKQAELTGEALKDEDIKAIFSSPQGRATQTAEIIADSLGLDRVRQLEGLRELNFGLLEGGPVPTFGPDGNRPAWLKPITDLVRYLSGESKGRFTRRIAEAASFLMNSQDEGAILVISHWGTLSVMMDLLFSGNSKYWLEEVKWSACGISKIQKTPSGWEVLQQDSIEHLQEIKE